jgi:ADP-dependent NAD(P)H-hydrate dehydratase / NAD(P)H-hydrate epimerase
VTWPALPWSQVPAISSTTVREADRRAREEYGIEPLQLMEIAGWQVARVVDTLLGGSAGKRVAVVAGSGNNGGDALAAARMLHQRGARVRVSIVPSRDPSSLSARHRLTVERLGIGVDPAPAGLERAADVLIDGLLGTGIHLPLREPMPAIIAAMNGLGCPVVAVDVPSGLDADTGAGSQTAVRAAATVTLAVAKPALADTPNAGRVFVADIGMPAALFGEHSHAIAAAYSRGDLVELVA